MAKKKIVRRGSGPFVISGNDLREGHVVWRAAGPRWVLSFEEAHVLQTEADAAAAMAQATEDRRELQAVDVHVVDIAMPGNVMVPITYRERVRAFGPTTAFGRHEPAEMGA